MFFCLFVLFISLNHSLWKSLSQEYASSLAFIFTGIWDYADPSLHSPFLCTAWWEDVNEGGWMEGVFGLLLVSHCSRLLVIGSKLHWSPYAESVLPVTVVGEWSPCPCFNPLSFSIVCSLEEGEWERMFWSLASHQCETTTMGQRQTFQCFK